jgi:hypothetical protein
MRMRDDADSHAASGRQIHVPEPSAGHIEPLPLSPSPTLYPLSAGRAVLLQRRRRSRPSQNASTQRDCLLQRPDPGRHSLPLRSRPAQHQAGVLWGRPGRTASVARGD